MRFSVIAALIAVSLSSAGCHTMRQVTLEELGAIRPSQVVVTRADQSTVIVSGPQTFGDTLVGYVNGQFEEMPGDDLKQMLVRRPAKGKTMALAAAGLVGIGLVAYMVSSTGGEKSPERLLDCEDDPELPGCPLGPPVP